ncbi:anti-sigma F factor antagonist [Clostridium hydrogenum]|uniref:anti-sigma F factor antagonist n=1 Tax=Clostridium hydrogenum TaxID=2855764 RepID=UPI001F34A56F|nr:anti-sigma F factor antagonist [Clostridium hydrogenum]
MDLEFKQVNDKLIISIIGELDHHSTDEIRNKIDDKIKSGGYKKVILDFSHVTFMDSSGIGVIIGRYKKLKLSNGVLCIANISNSVKKVFELSGLFKIINVYNNVNLAVESI